MFGEMVVGRDSYLLPKDSLLQTQSTIQEDGVFIKHKMFIFAGMHGGFFVVLLIMDCKINSVSIKLLLYKKMDKIIDGTKKLSAKCRILLDFTLWVF